MKDKIVSIIIPTKNTSRTLFACLQSIQSQTYPLKNIEIIVVDNGSTDTTKAIANKFSVICIEQKGLERSAQRNAGAVEAKGKYLFFLDADMAISRGLIVEAVSLLEEESDIVGLYVPEIIKGKGYWGKVRNFERSFYNETPIDAVRIIRKDVFISIKGFDESLWGGEDWDLNKRMQKYGRTATTTKPLYHNEEHFSIILYLKKKQYYSESLLQYKKKWGRKNTDIQKQIGFWYRFFFVFTEKGKWKKLFRHPLLFVGILFLRLGVGLIFVWTKISHSNK